jgi:hypothetical protein
MRQLEKKEGQESPILLANVLATQHSMLFSDQDYLLH